MQKLWMVMLVALLVVIGCKKNEENQTVVISGTPTVSSVSPADGSASVATSGSLEVTFSAAMSSGSLNTNESGSSCSGSIQLSADSFATCATLAPPSLDSTGKVATVTYSGLTSATTYQAKITTAATASGGSALASTYSWSFVTASSSTDSTAPASAALSIEGGASATTSTTVTVTLSATDATGVTGYYLSSSSSTPSASASGWISLTAATSLSTSASYSLSNTEGTQTLYAWFKDAAGNLSSAASDSILFTSTWTKQPGNASAQDGNALTLDADGNVIVVGATSGSLDGAASSGGYDAFITKYNAAGTWQWTTQVGSIGSEAATAVATDSSGNIYWVGTTDNSVSPNTSSGGIDVLVGKIDASGTQVWLAQPGTSGSDYATGIKVSSAGDLYITGYSTGSFSGSNPGGTDLWFAKLNSSSALQWITQRNQTGNQLSYGIVLDSSGNIYIGGDTDTAMDGLAYMGGTYDAFVSKFDTSGSWVWTSAFGSATEDHVKQIAIDSSDNLYLSGSTDGNWDGESAHGGMDLHLTKYNSSGARQWTRIRGTNLTEEGRSLAIANNKIYLFGTTQGSLDGNSLTGTTDVALLEFSSDGTWNWTKQLGNSAAALTAYGLAPSKNGDLNITGSTTGAFSGFSQQGVRDVYLIKNPSGYLP
ncbi:MAG: SBBP repeat-containing protein [bacterium]|nr:SBBP repeat-containing protein [bacterium]